MNWPDVVGGVGGVTGVAVALVLGIRSLAVSRESRDEARRSADAGERSAAAAEDSARAGQDSANAAQLSADYARTVADIEQERRCDERAQRHRELGPPQPGQIDYVREQNAALPGYSDIFGTVTVGRDYRADMEVVRKSKSTSSLGTVLLRANQQHRFHIEQLPPDRATPETKFIRFRFSPPLETDTDIEHWSCPCDLPVAESGRGGHWEWLVPIVDTTAQQVFARIGRPTR